jgi:hypothetical protein
MSKKGSRVRKASDVRRASRLLERPERAGIGKKIGNGQARRKGK